MYVRCEEGMKAKTIRRRRRLPGTYLYNEEKKNRMYNYYSLGSSLAITFSSGSILAATSNNGSHTLFCNTISEAKSLPFNFPFSYLFMSPMPQHRPSVQLIGHPQQNPLRLQPWCVVKSLGTNSSARSGQFPNRLQ